MISYEGLLARLREKGITKTDLTKELGISSRTIAKIAKGEKLGAITPASHRYRSAFQYSDLCNRL